jgi:hypothetical protein
MESVDLRDIGPPLLLGHQVLGPAKSRAID